MCCEPIERGNGTDTGALRTAVRLSSRCRQFWRNRRESAVSFGGPPQPLKWESSAPLYNVVLVHERLRSPFARTLEARQPNDWAFSSARSGGAAFENVNASLRESLDSELGRTLRLRIDASDSSDSLKPRADHLAADQSNISVAAEFARRFAPRTLYVVSFDSQFVRQSVQTSCSATLDDVTQRATRGPQFFDAGYQ